MEHRTRDNKKRMELNYFKIYIYITKYALFNIRMILRFFKRFFYFYFYFELLFGDIYNKTETKKTGGGMID